MQRQEILDKVAEIICKDRDKQYGKPEDNFELIAHFWSDYLGFEIAPSNVGVMMSLLKIARIATGEYKEDSYLDAIGYMACALSIESEEQKW